MRSVTVLACLVVLLAAAPALAAPEGTGGTFPGGGATGGTFPGGGATDGIFPGSAGGSGNAAVHTLEPSVLAVTGAGLLCASLFRRRR